MIREEFIPDVFFSALIIAGAAAALVGCTSSEGKTSTAKADVNHGTIVRVVDGDTIKVDVSGKTKSVRLIGIDTPETHKPGVKIECGGREASANMAKLAPEGARVTLRSDPSQDSVDRYGRLLAYATVRGRSLQLEQVYAGWATVYVYQHHPFSRVDAFRRAEGVAKRADRGVWGECGGDFHSEQ